MDINQTVEELEARTKLAVALYARRLALVILFCGLGITLLAWYLTHSNSLIQTRQLLEEEGEEVVTSFLRQMSSANQTLRGVVGLFCSSEEVSYEEWTRYTTNLELERFRSGIVAVAVTIPATQAEANTFRQLQSTESAQPTFSRITADPEAAVLLHIFPETASHKNAIGMNMWVSDARREAMIRAEDSGKAATTAALRPADSTAGIGGGRRDFATYLPYYEGCVTPPTVAQRRAKLRGWISAAYRAEDWIGSTSTDQRHFQIYTSTHRDAETFLYSSTGSHNPRAWLGATYYNTKDFVLDGAEWSLEYFSYEPIGERRLFSPATWVAVAGILFNVMLFYLILSLSLVNVRAQALARRITQDLGDAKAALEETINTLERTNAELDRFVYVVCHDLSAPLRGIKNLVEWTLEDHGAQMPAEAVDFVTKMQARARSMELLLKDLLNFSRVGRISEEMELVSLAELVETQKDLLNIPASFVVEVVADQQLLLPRVGIGQVLRNLIQNAVAHHHRDAGKVAIAVKESENHLQFSVADDGPGIAAEYQQAVFKIFKRLPKSVNTEGTGIGLSIVKKVVERYGGRVWFESDGKSGTTFYFTFPKRAAN